MKKFNISLIIPIFFIIVSVLAAVFLSSDIFEYFIMSVGAIFNIALCIAAIYMIVHHDMDLRHNFPAYIIAVIISLILIIISYTVFNAFSSLAAMFGFPIVNIILMKFYFDKNKTESEAFVWFLLNPNIYYIVFLICIGAVIMLHFQM